MKPDLPSSAADRLDVALLGTFSVTLAGAAIPSERWPSLRSMHLIQLLALAERHRLAREQVIDSLWPQLDPDAGAANLRKAVHHARQALGRQDCVVLHGGDVMLAPALDVCVDANVFEQRARAALTSREAAACGAAAAMYCGDLLPAARYEAWAEPARERLHSLQVALLRAAGDWEGLAERDPTDERAHRELMGRELAAGNRAAAIRWYARLRTALQREL
ncbi:MAG TPA: BTAD domain-containing putative transcriptional regulator, partial [Albitalea sp.]|nr:BTAD domain-containing putative transcriptional regulator [Albitalea sp.]